MSIPSLCPQCGAAIRIPADAHAATCGQCGARLNELECESDQDRIDREWETERERYLVTSRLGGRYAPSIAASVVMAVFVVGLGVFWFTMAFIMGDRGNAPLFSLFGAAIVVVGLAISYHQYHKARRYRAAYRAYRRRRTEGVG